MNRCYDRNKEETMINNIIKKASTGYPDGLIAYWNFRTKHTRNIPGDTLALFIVREIASVYDPGESEAWNIRTIKRALRHAIRDIRGTIKALEDKGGISQ